MHTYERFMLRHYIRNILQAPRFKRPPYGRAHDLYTWICKERRSLGLPALHFPPKDEDNRWDRPLTQSWHEWRIKTIASIAEAAPEKSPLQKRLDWLAAACGLNGSQTFLLGLFARLSAIDIVRMLVRALEDHTCDLSRFFELSDVESLFDRCVNPDDLKEQATLLRMGLLTKEDHRGMRASDLTLAVMRCRRLDSVHLSKIIFGNPRPATLSWDDFEHLGYLRNVASRLLSAAVARGSARKPTNILFYGDPGTGKTEFAKTLGAIVGGRVQFVGESESSGAEPNRRERVAAFLLANMLGRTDERLVLVVDEADDLFAGVDEDNAATRHGSKVFMNRLIETARVPTIWIANDLSRLGRAVVRRMNLVVRFPKPNLGARRKIVERIAERLDFHMDDGSIAKLAFMQAAPSLLETAIAATARINGSTDDALTILRSGMKAIGQFQPLYAPAPLTFDPVLSSADVDLQDLADRIAKAPTTALSFCLSGPPGTGKSAYARYLAQRLNMEVIDKRFSDLISPWLGESEKAIAYAFEEAADQKAFLIFDEADSLLRDRRAAQHSWEITQVNEMLCAMERHPYPFACTTNMPDCLDEATARRFLFKVSFLPMKETQIAWAFKNSFGLDCPKFIAKLDLVTPGDFAVVVRKAKALGESNADQIARWLIAEIRAKPAGQKTKIGF